VSAIRLAVLDMAGTTVADDGAVEQAFRAALPRDHDADRAFDHVRRTMGQSKIAVFRELFDGDEAQAQAANRRFEQAFAAAVDRGDVSAIDGVPETLARLRDAGVRVCLTTGFSPSTRDRIIDVLDWRTAVDLALSPADAGRGRPFPDMILTAVLRLGVDDVRQVAVAGDTASDLLAGTRAGASIVAGVLSGAHTRAELEQAPHTHIIDRVTDLPQLIPV
jgi:phosphonatase-like hydrolase